jgi:DNA-3-methyladenine glycosylase II
MKARYVLNLARAVHDGSVPLDEVHSWDDEAIIAALTSIKGVGPWTAEMFLIFALGRPDVLSPGDLGIRAGLKGFYGLDELPNPRLCRELTEKWRPHRTVAMWYLWEGIDNPKKSG